MFLCRDKAGGRAIGTVRIQASAFGPLLLESSLILPPWLPRAPRSPGWRCGRRRPADPPGLMKASYLYCLANQLRWMVIGARSEALIRIYRRLGFIDVLAPDDACRWPMPAACRTASWLSTWRPNAPGARGHGLYPFMVETFHPDLQLFALPQRRRRAARAEAAAAAGLRRLGSPADSDARGAQRSSSAHQFVAREGLGDEVVHAGVQARLAVDVGGGGGERDHRQPRQAQRCAPARGSRAWRPCRPSPACGSPSAPGRAG